LQRAIEKVGKVREKKGGSTSGGSKTGIRGRGGSTEGQSTTASESPSESRTATTTPAAPPNVKIDWDGIHDRIHRIAIPNSPESGLMWSHDSKKIAFTDSGDGRART